MVVWWKIAYRLSTQAVSANGLRLRNVQQATNRDDEVAGIAYVLEHRGVVHIQSGDCENLRVATTGAAYLQRAYFSCTILQTTQTLEHDVEHVDRHTV